MNDNAILKVKNLSIEFKSENKWTPIIRGVSYELYRGEILAIVGESGSGKSVTNMSLTRLIPEYVSRITSGEVFFNDGEKIIDTLKLTSRELQKFRGKRIAYIFQEPSVSLNPVIRIGEQIAEALKLHRPEIKDRKGEVVSLLDQVGIPEPKLRYKSYPHEMSGGMQQRVMIAMALACNPDILIADEPTTALDVTIQAQILELLCELREKRDMSIILITHNLGVVSKVADRVLVMYDGTTIEYAPVRTVIDRPQHPYTKALLRAVPKMGETLAPFDEIPGMPEDLYRTDKKFEWIQVSEEHWVRGLTL